MTLHELRQQIDALDEKILECLRQRAEWVHEVGRIKQQTGEPFYVPEREEAMLRKLAERNQSRLPAGAVRAIYREILSAMRALEQNIVVAYLGPQATFSHQAARQHFGESVEFLPERTIGDVFEAVERGRAHYGVAPVENSIEGAVHSTLDRFIESPLRICAQILLQVDLNLLARCELPDVRRVVSHPQPFGQCRRWLSAHLPQAECIEASSTTRAAEIAAGEPHTAAIASGMAADLFGLRIIAPAIQDSATNVTRFFVIGRDAARPSGHDKTSIVFAVKDRPGALAGALEPFHRAGISLTRIESRPSKRKAWEYVFFADLLGHADDPALSDALHALETGCSFFKILGSYPHAE